MFYSITWNNWKQGKNFISASAGYCRLATMLQLVPETINFSTEEEKILSFWNEIKAFEECMIKSKGKPR